MQLRSVSKLLGHRKCIMSCAFSPDDKMIASGSNDCTVRVWDTQRCKQIIEYDSHHSEVRSVTWSSLHQMIASSNRHCSVSLWDLRQKRSMQTISWCTFPEDPYVDFDPGEVFISTFSSDGNLLAFGGMTDFLQIWDIRKMGRLLEIDTISTKYFTVNSIDFSRDDSILALACEKTVVWDIKHNRPKHVLDHYASSFKFSPDRDIFALAFNVEEDTCHRDELKKIVDKIIICRATENEFGEVVTRIKYRKGHQVRNISFSSDSNFFAHFTSGYNIIVHDVFTGQLCCTV